MNGYLKNYNGIPVSLSCTLWQTYLLHAIMNKLFTALKSDEDMTGYYLPTKSSRVLWYFYFDNNHDT